MPDPTVYVPAPPAAPAPAAPVAPAAPAAPNLQALPGESPSQYEARLGAMSGRAPGEGFGTPVTPRPVTDTSSAQDEVAKQFGYNSYAEAVAALSGNGKSTTDFYNDAYKAAGLDQLLGQITSRKNDLNTAIGKINDNPWLDEANRVGRTRNLQTLAEGDIKNLTDEYTTKLGSVHDLVTRHDTDVANNQKKLDFLEAQAKSLADEAATKAKTESTAPTTIKGANGATYQWDPNSKSFKQILPGKDTSSADSQKTIDKFNKDLANRAALDRDGTRELFIKRLQSLYPDIDPNDIARKVYETYPDGYEKKSKSDPTNGKAWWQFW